MRHWIPERPRKEENSKAIYMSGMLSGLILGIAATSIAFTMLLFTATCR